MNDQRPASRVLIWLRLVYPPTADPAVQQERRLRQDATARPLALMFALVGALGVPVAALGVLSSDWIPVVLGLFLATVGAMGCRKFVRFRRRPRLGR